MVKFSAAKVDLQVTSIEAGLAVGPHPIYLAVPLPWHSEPVVGFMLAKRPEAEVRGKEPDKALAGILRFALAMLEAAPICRPSLHWKSYEIIYGRCGQLT